MAEYERIAEKYGCSVELQDEVKCDFLVTKKLRKIQLIELDLLLEFDKACRENGLKYFLFGGTLLGAIRHQGFIPWDDDVDVVMFRDDYEKLKRLGNKVFVPPYFVQFPGQDEDYFFSFAKLRNSNTCDISVPFRNCKFKQGLCMDIFVLDNCNLDDVQENYVNGRKLVLVNSANMRRSLLHPTEEDIKRMQEYPQRDMQEIFSEFERLMRMYEKTDTEYIVLSNTFVYPVEKFVYRREWFEKCVEMVFEGYNFMAPSGYKNVLRTLYGDYMQFPPVEKRGTWHNKNIHDPDISYREWQKQYVDV